MGMKKNKCFVLLLVFMTIITCSSCGNGNKLDSFAKVELAGIVYDLREKPSDIYNKMVENNVTVQFYNGCLYLWEDNKFKYVNADEYYKPYNHDETTQPRVECIVQICEKYPEDDIERLAKSRISYMFGAGDNTDYKVNKNINYESDAEKLYTKEFEFGEHWDYFKKLNLRSIYDFNQYCLLDGFYTVTYSRHSLNAVFFDEKPVYLQDYATSALSEEKQNEYRDIRQKMALNHYINTYPLHITDFYREISDEELELSRINNPVEEGFYNAMCEGVLKIHNGEISEVYGVTLIGNRYFLSIISKDGQVLMKGEKTGELIWK